ncbi:MAG: J domain-containing protein [Hyphomicrobiaceae bacterium]
MIRASRKGERQEQGPKGPSCAWRDCNHVAEFRAPKGRGHDGEFYMFCAEHVRRYNASYNYFDGMSDNEVEQFVQSAAYGHRPTWKVGANSWAHGTRQPRKGSETGTKRPAEAQSFHAWRAKQARNDQPAAGRHLKPLERKAMTTLDLGADATKEEIKARFKELVKRHHPDLNGGDRGTEDKLREIIQAYNYLKQAGLV